MSLPRIEDLHDDVSLERRLSHATPDIRGLIERVLDGGTLTVDEGVRLLDCEGDDVLALIAAADAIRKADVGDDVTYVVNRNVNFTNVCFVGCRFCAFKRQRWESDAYNQSVETILAKVQEAVDRGATEICMQGGINPDMPPFTYRDILIAIKQAFPAIHMHAFSPMEVMYGARRTNMSYETTSAC
jgi:FO synthase